MRPGMWNSRVLVMENLGFISFSSFKMPMSQKVVLCSKLVIRKLLLPVTLFMGLKKKKSSYEN